MAPQWLRLESLDDTDDADDSTCLMILLVAKRGC